MTDATDHSMKTIFNTKFEEFARDLSLTCPELKGEINAALALSPADRLLRFKSDVMPSCSPTRDSSKAPSICLPGVSMPAEIWVTLGKKSKSAIHEYLTVLSFTCLMDGAEDTPPEGFPGWSAEWANQTAEKMKNGLGNFDFAGITEKIAALFGKGDLSGSPFPALPEKFMKGQIAKLAEEIVKEFKLEDFGLDAAAMEAAGNDPSKALGMIMEVFTKNPQNFQATIMKMAKRLQAKVQSGAIRPQDLVAEAEELMKTFSENPQFVDLMETFRQTFGMEGHEDEARAAGRDGSARLSLVQQRLRKKLEAKKAGAGKK